MAGLVDGALTVRVCGETPTRLLVVRRGNPLAFGERRAGSILPACRKDLPGKVIPIRIDMPGCSRSTMAGFATTPIKIGR